MWLAVLGRAESSECAVCLGPKMTSCSTHDHGCAPNAVVGGSVWLEGTAVRIAKLSTTDVHLQQERIDNLCKVHSRSFQDQSSIKTHSFG
jgi:hypothetical protein